MKLFFLILNINSILVIGYILYGTEISTIYSVENPLLFYILLGMNLIIMILNTNDIKNYISEGAIRISRIILKLLTGGSSLFLNILGFKLINLEWSKLDNIPLRFGLSIERNYHYSELKTYLLDYLEKINSRLSINNITIDQLELEHLLLKYPKPQLLTLKLDELIGLKIQAKINEKEEQLSNLKKEIIDSINSTNQEGFLNTIWDNKLIILGGLVGLLAIGGFGYLIYKYIKLDDSVSSLIEIEKLRSEESKRAIGALDQLNTERTEVSNALAEEISSLRSSTNQAFSGVASELNQLKEASSEIDNLKSGMLSLKEYANALQLSHSEDHETLKKLVEFINKLIEKREIFSNLGIDLDSMSTINDYFFLLTAGRTILEKIGDSSYSDVMDKFDEAINQYIAESGKETITSLSSSATFTPFKGIGKLLGRD